MNPLVSIILPTYKGAPRIASAIESVQAQGFTNWELVIVDDGLYMDARKLVEDFSAKDKRIILVENANNAGLQRALNRGLAVARGSFIARIDDDDTWSDPDKLAQQVDFLEGNQDHVLVGTNAILCNENGKLFGRYSMPTDDEAIRSRMLLKNCFLHPSIMARKEAVVEVGGYSERSDVTHIEDYDLWLRLGSVGKIANIALPAVCLTIHAESLTFQNRFLQAKRMWTLIRQYRNNYPNFILGRIILSLRISGFAVLKIVPLPKGLLYKIQELYKRL